MKRAPSKKAIERRKKPRSAATGRKPAARVGASAGSASQAATAQKARLIEAPGLPSAAQAAGPQVAVETEESCQNCGKVLVADDRALFVEEEVGRIFCCEGCITGYFNPEIERLEKEYYRRLPEDDLSQSERESYSHLRWITLQEPDEIWREKTLSGDHRYTLISEFRPGATRVWCVCICLFLKGEPSFLYLAFTTKSPAMVGAYRRGERVEWAKENRKSSKQARQMDSEDTDSDDEIEASGDEPVETAAASDRLADEWTDDETFLAEVNQERRDDDIPSEEFSAYERCLEETLETPDEVWSCRPGKSTVKLYHFIRHYRPSPDDEEAQGYWYVIVARELEDDEQIEVVDAFPTRDTRLVDRYRRGEQEVGHTSPGPSSRVVH